MNKSLKKSCRKQFGFKDSLLSLFFFPINKSYFYKNILPINFPPKTPIFPSYNFLQKIVKILLTFYFSYVKINYKFLGGNLWKKY